MMTTEQMKPLYRTATIEKRAIDEESRTVKLAFSSEEPVARWEGKEILDHDPASIRLGRLNGGGAVLVDHNPADHIGVVESVSIGSDRIGRAVVRFGKSTRASEVFTDVVDGIRKSVSVGYRIYRVLSEGEDQYRVVDWEPIEISMVSVPADASVGVGRADVESNQCEFIENKTMPEVENIEPVESNAPLIDAEKIRTDTVNTERARVQDLLELGRKHDQGDLAQRFIASGRSANDLKDVVEFMTDKAPSFRAVEEPPASEIGLNNKETRTFSLMRAIRAQVTGNWRGAEFELECSRNIAEKIGRDPRGFFVPHEIQSRVFSKREMSTTVDGVGLVGTDHLASSFIDSLRDESVVISAGATMLPGLVGNVSIPKKTASGTFTWLAEGGDSVSSDATIGAVTMSPKTVSGSVEMTRRLVKQSSPAIEALIQRDLTQGAALAIDLAAIQGSGTSNEPTGIVNQTGINTQTIAAAATTGYPTWPELVGFETSVATDNALRGALAYVTTAAIRGGLKTTAKDAGSGLFLMEGNDANGYNVLSTNQQTAKQIVFGNFNDVLIGMWGVLDIMPDSSTHAASGGLILRVFQDVDIAVRHASSFCKNA